jgi:hypothetical protein
MTSRNRTLLQRLVALSGAATIGMSIGACSRSSGPEAPEQAALSPSDFRGDGDAADAAESPDAGKGMPATSRIPIQPEPSAPGASLTTRSITTAGPTGLQTLEPLEISTSVARDPRPVAATGTAVAGKPVDAGIVLDALVGQVNGKPIFASEVLEPLDGRLRGLAGQAKRRDAWKREATRIIDEEVNKRVLDELVLAEARSNLTPEQNKGLISFFNSLQQDLVSRNRGSAVVADESLRESSGRSLAKEAQDRLDQALIAEELRNKVMPRITVSWRDVQNEYERNFETYNPPPVAHFRVIIVPTSNAAGISKVGGELASGASFKAVAGAAPNVFNRTAAGELDRDITTSLGETKVSDIKELDDAGRTLSPGQTAGPLTYGKSGESTAWIHLENIETRPGKALSEVQLEIENKLKVQRERTEKERYFRRLVERGNVTKLEEIRDRLIVVATERYLPPTLR